MGLKETDTSFFFFNINSSYYNCTILNRVTKIHGALSTMLKRIHRQAWTVVLQFDSVSPQAQLLGFVK
jgi:hypothetical protein